MHNRDKMHCPRGHPYVEGNIVWNSKYKADGTRGRRCAECHRQWSREYYHRRRERFRQENEDAWREMIREKDRRFMERHPEKEAAHRLVTTALRLGRLPRPDACQRCDTSCTPEASHDDYSKPYEVEWLCRRCHAIKDRKHNAVVTDRAFTSVKASADTDSPNEDT
jgi:hypothetical protein